MKLTNNKYKLIFAIQTFLLSSDLCINTFGVLARKYNAVVLVLFIIQDIFIVLALSILLLLIFSTYVFQVGLVGLLYDKFRFTIIICTIYFILTTILYIWVLTLRWKDPFKHNWSIGLYIMYITHRFFSPIYYYFYKRSALTITDPQFYEEKHWQPKTTINTT
ncbi:transmembrane protein 138 [Onthophagus taurus]|uniref:transmembrane protein 138 n=1 Tax=Onthophagus taurus TaxID=166361 RepID=UPI000C200869|nr:transmembrane protein 138 [Onthophagus taurus]XP_022910552.1 transmembrane protein 138 [Onthophagus taurus]